MCIIIAEKLYNYTMKFELGDLDLDEYQRLLENSNYKRIYRASQFLRVWVRGLPGVILKFLISDRVVLPALIFKRGPLKALYSLPYQTFGGPVGNLSEEIELEHDFQKFSEVAIDDPEYLLRIPGLEIKTAREAFINLSGGYSRVFTRYAPSRRKIVRKLRKNPPDVREFKGENDILLIYPLYHEFVQSKNIQIFPQRFFHVLVEHLYPQNIYGFVALSGGKPAGYIINVYGYGEAISFSHVWRKGEKNLSTFLIDLSIQRAAELGLKEFSLGLTNESMQGVLAFKRSFGVDFRPMRTYWKRTFYHNLARNIKTGLRKWLRF